MYHRFRIIYLWYELCQRTGVIKVWHLLSKLGTSAQVLDLEAKVVLKLRDKKYKT